MCKPDLADRLIKDDYAAVVAMVRSGAKHSCGVKLSQKNCEVLMTVLQRSVDISPLMDAVSKVLENTVLTWRNYDGKNPSIHP